MCGRAARPRRICAGRVTSGLLTNLDLFPTLLGLAGVGLPSDRVIDGVDVLAVLDGSAARSPRESFFYCHYHELMTAWQAQQDPNPRGFALAARLTASSRA